MRLAHLVIAAPLAIEAAAIRRGLSSTAGSPDSAEVTVLRTGMGPAKARLAIRASRAIVTRRPDAVVVVGFGGGLSDGQRPGDVVLASEVRSPAASVPCSPAEALEFSLRAKGFRVHRGSMATVDHVVRPAERRRLADAGAIAVDMESAAIGEAVGQLTGFEDVSFAALRVLVDTPSRPLVHPATVAGGLAAMRVLAGIGPVLREWADSPNSLDMSDMNDMNESKNKESRDYSKR